MRDRCIAASVFAAAARPTELDSPDSYVSWQAKALFRTRWRRSPLDIGVAGVDVVSIGHYDTRRIPASELRLVLVGDRTQQRLQAVAYELIELAGVLGSQYGQRAHQPTHASGVVSGQLPLPGPACVPG